MDETIVTIRIRDSGKPTEFKIIRRADFDPSMHVEWHASMEVLKAERPAPQRAKGKK